MMPLMTASAINAVELLRSAAATGETPDRNQNQDQSAAVFERRVRDYETRVEPVIEAWARADLPLIRLDGTRDVDAIAIELLDEVARLEGG